MRGAIDLLSIYMHFLRGDTVFDRKDAEGFRGVLEYRLFSHHGVYWISYVSVLNRAGRLDKDLVVSDQRATQVKLYII